MQITDLCVHFPQPTQGGRYTRQGTHADNNYQSLELVLYEGIS